MRLLSTSPALPLLTVICLTLLLPAFAAADAEPPLHPPIADRCLEDLAQRLKVPVADLQIDAIDPVLWPSPALGLGRPDQPAPPLATPGYLLRLSSPRGDFRYHTSEGEFVFAGAESLWNYSVAYLQPVANEPNLNSDLVQVSLQGTAPVVVLPRVNGFATHPAGGYLATRRTSRSGHHLLYLPPGSLGPATVLEGAVDFGSPVYNSEGERWAVVARPRLGQSPRLWMGLTGQSHDLDCDLPPAGRVLSLTWTERWPRAVVLVGEDRQVWQLARENGAFRWEQEAPLLLGGSFSEMLDRSYSMEALQTTDEAGKPEVRVQLVHFSGRVTLVYATVPGLQLEDMQLSPDEAFMLLVGRRGERRVGLTVSLRAEAGLGEVYETVPHSQGPIRLLDRPALVPLLVSPLLGEMTSGPIEQPEE